MAYAKASLGAPTISDIKLSLPPISITPAAPPTIVGITDSGAPIFDNMPPSSQPKPSMNIPTLAGLALLGFLLVRRR